MHVKNEKNVLLDTFETRRAWKGIKTSKVALLSVNCLSTCVFFKIPNRAILIFPNFSYVCFLAVSFSLFCALGVKKIWL